MLQAIESVYLLRPTTQGVTATGSIPLVTTANGGNILGSFDVFLSPTDGIGVTEVGSVAAVASTPDSWFLEQTGSGITFHYHVTASVPEPGTFAFFVAGVILVSMMRRKEIE